MPAEPGRPRGQGAPGSARGPRSPLALAALGATLIGALLTTLVAPPRPRLLWNATASSPIGLYAVGPAPVRPLGMVAAWAPSTARDLAATRHYLPRNVPLVKPVAAASGDKVCARGLDILVNGRRVAVRREHDLRGRPLPWWTGCRRLRAGELLLLSGDNPLAFDGRYFGVTEPAQVVGSARLLWPR